MTTAAAGLIAAGLQPQQFLAPAPGLSKSLVQALKEVFDHARQTQPMRLGPLQKLLVKDFDTETIWEQLQLRNLAVQKFGRHVTQRLLQNAGLLRVRFPLTRPVSILRDMLAFRQLIEDEREDERTSQRGQSEPESELLEIHCSTNQGTGEQHHNNAEGLAVTTRDVSLRTGTPSHLGQRAHAEDGFGGDSDNDVQQQKVQTKSLPPPDFFDYDEMEQMADEAEREEYGESSEESASNAEDSGSEEALHAGDEEGGAEIRYDDFFEQDGEAGMGFAEEEEEEDDEEEGVAEEDRPGIVQAGKYTALVGDDAQESSEEEVSASPSKREQRRKRKEIEELESELIAERPWEYRGEIRARDRPENSLLEMDLDVERAIRPSLQLVAAETSQSVDEMIKKRVLEGRWDDPLPKDVGEERLMNRRGRQELPEVSQEKSREGLGEIYEKEYMRLAVGVEGESAESKQKRDMAGLFRKLCTRLDALSNFHFTPKPAKFDLTVRANVPAIAMEEVLPLAISQADTQAPEEVQEKRRGREGILRDPAEWGQEDRQRARRGKKAARRKAKQKAEADERLIARIRPGLGNKYAAEKLRSEIRHDAQVVQGRLENGNKTQVGDEERDRRFPSTALKL